MKYSLEEAKEILHEKMRDFSFDPDFVGPRMMSKPRLDADGLLAQQMRDVTDAVLAEMAPEERAKFEGDSPIIVDGIDDEDDL